jgi:hypothetical protein
VNDDKRPEQFALAIDFRATTKELQAGRDLHLYSLWMAELLLVLPA